MLLEKRRNNRTFEKNYFVTYSDEYTDVSIVYYLNTLLRKYGLLNEPESAFELSFTGRNGSVSDVCDVSTTSNWYPGSLSVSSTLRKTGLLSERVIDFLRASVNRDSFEKTGIIDREILNGSICDDQKQYVYNEKKAYRYVGRIPESRLLRHKKHLKRCILSVSTKWSQIGIRIFTNRNVNILKNGPGRMPENYLPVSLINCSVRMPQCAA